MQVLQCGSALNKKCIVFLPGLSLLFKFSQSQQIVDVTTGLVFSYFYCGKSFKPGSLKLDELTRVRGPTI